MYRLLRPVLFRLDPETAHDRIARLCRLVVRSAPGRALVRALWGAPPGSPRLRVCGIDFPNPVGMAAGFDKTGELYPFLALAGFGFVECGTFTAVAQAGNPRPRIFRFPADEALVNRMGFNNPGAGEAARHLGRALLTVPRGISIGKSRVAPLERAVEDQMEALAALLPAADYVAINISSPNTPGLRQQQEASRLRELVAAARERIAAGGRAVPLFVKLAPDLAEGELEALVAAGQEAGLDGVILTNTTLDKSAVAAATAVEGGLSGAPLRRRATELVRRCHRATGGRLPIIGVGGIFSGPDALEKILAGASLVQLYTGYIYRGPRLPRDINRYLARVCRERRTSLDALVGKGELP